MYNLFAFLKHPVVYAACVTAAITLSSAPGHAAEPVKDNPLAGRYEGAEMVFGEIKAYDEAELIQGSLSEVEASDAGYKGFSKLSLTPNVVRVEGRVSSYQYKLPAERGLLEVQRSYENSLKSKGFRVAFTCKVVGAGDDGSCFKSESKTVNKPLEKFRIMLGSINWPARTRYDVLKDHPQIEFFFKVSGRYLLMKREGAEGTDYVSIALSEKTSDMVFDHGKVIDENTAFVRVVESKSMDSGMITFLNADDMKKSLDKTGRVNLYGIYFDTDKDTLKPESKPMLDEITKLMRDNKALRLRVVGHTDSTGNEPHNLDLSNRRAASVIRALTQAGIDASRFAPRGAGASEPVATNDTTDGRAKNRRVELVRM